MSSITEKDCLGAICVVDELDGHLLAHLDAWDRADIHNHGLRWLSRQVARSPYRSFDLWLNVVYTRHPC